MSSDMSGPLSDKLDGTTPNALVTNTCLSAGESPEKTPFLFQVHATPYLTGLVAGVLPWRSDGPT